VPGSEEVVDELVAAAGDDDGDSVGELGDKQRPEATVGLQLFEKEGFGDLDEGQMRV
jgi:hypothetical protein